MIQRKHYYLQHGWAFNGECYSKWRNCLENSKVTILDRGYWGEAAPFRGVSNNEFSVLVCHSLGVHFFSNEQLSSFDMLVIVNGFANFHGLVQSGSQISRKHIKRMQSRLEQEPEKLIQDFFNDCSWTGGLPNASFMNSALLSQDLFLLDTATLSYEPSKVTKILILHGANDRIVSVDRAYELQSQLSGSQVCVIDGAGHGLPFTYFDDCINCINHQL